MDYMGYRWLGGGSYIAYSAFDVDRQVSGREGDGHVNIQLVTESDERQIEKVPFST